MRVARGLAGTESPTRVEGRRQRRWVMGVASYLARHGRVGAPLAFGLLQLALHLGGEICRALLAPAARSRSVASSTCISCCCRDQAAAASRCLGDLGVHSGMIGESVMGLMESGAISNAHKGIDAGVTVAVRVNEL